jgi:hypothetical protein
MKKFDIRALFFGVGIYTIVNIFNSIIDSWVKNYVSYELFGEAGAYSFEDQAKIGSHPIYFYYDFFSSVLELIISCSIVAYYSRHSEIINSCVMAFLIAFFGAIYWYGQYPSYFIGMFLLVCTFYGLIAILIGYIFYKTKNKNV